MIRNKTFLYPVFYASMILSMYIYYNSPVFYKLYHSKNQESVLAHAECSQSLTINEMRPLSIISVWDLFSLSPLLFFQNYTPEPLAGGAYGCKFTYNFKGSDIETKKSFRFPSSQLTSHILKILEERNGLRILVDISNPTDVYFYKTVPTLEEYKRLFISTLILLSSFLSLLKISIIKDLSKLCVIFLLGFLFALHEYAHLYIICLLLLRLYIFIISKSYIVFKSKSVKDKVK